MQKLRLKGLISLWKFLPLTWIGLIGQTGSTKHPNTAQGTFAAYMKSLTFIDLAENNGDIVGWESRKCERHPAARLATFPTPSRTHIGSWSTKKQKTNITRSQRIGPQAATEESRILFFVRGDSTPQSVERAAATVLGKTTATP